MPLILISCCVQEADLKQIFEPFGPVDFVTLQKDTSGRSQGYGFVQCVPFPKSSCPSASLWQSSASLLLGNAYLCCSMH